MKKTVLVFCATAILAAVGPQTATADFHTRLNVRADDITSSYYRPSPDYEETVEDVISASASVGYDDGRLSKPYNYPMLATAEAAFNLKTGSIGFYIDCMGKDANARATVEMSDVIAPFWVSGSGPMSIEVTWTAAGQYTPYSWSYNENDWVVGGSPYNMALYSRFSYRVDDEPVISSPYNQYSLADGEDTWTRTILFDPAVNSTIVISQSIHGWLASFNSQYLRADFSNTSVIEMTLPDGADYTSDSGVFLIPEPTTLAMLPIGAMAMLKRRRRGD